MSVNIESNENVHCDIANGTECGVVIFGASGDLTHRKLLPAFFNLCRSKKIPEGFFIIGFARTAMDDGEYRKTVEAAIKNSLKPWKQEQVDGFVKKCFYMHGDYGDNEAYVKLKQRTEELSRQFATGGNLVFHLATPPELYSQIASKLGENGLIVKYADKTPFHRLIVEKPFGRDLTSAVNLNIDLLSWMSDSQIYRIDHYLGKETVQNILMFRFANSIFEPVWNRDYIDCVQITFAEQAGVGHRAGYFENAGLLRDILQNHMLQLAALVGMAPPVNLEAESVRDEKSKFMKSLRTIDMNNLQEYVIRGQYHEGEIDGKKVVAYRNESGVSPNSCTETFFAVKLFADNWRWEGVPFYIRGGKRLARNTAQITVLFKKTPHNLFDNNTGSTLEPNKLIFGIQPEQGVSLTFQAKVPGSKLCLSPLEMTFNYHDVFGGELTDDYETLLLDCMLGDQTLFWRKDAVEESWRLLTPVLQRWDSCDFGEKNTMMQAYESGSWGPQAAEDFMAKDGRKWIIK
jgi:glucose-6-phosphate 1-dehydrogenase